jgi:hypothetical protein
MLRPRKAPALTAKTVQQPDDQANNQHNYNNGSPEARLENIADQLARAKGYNHNQQYYPYLTK